VRRYVPLCLVGAPAGTLGAAALPARVSERSLTGSTRRPSPTSVTCVSRTPIEIPCIPMS